VLQVNTRLAETPTLCTTSEEGAIYHALTTSTSVAQSAAIRGDAALSGVAALSDDASHDVAPRYTLLSQQQASSLEDGADGSRRIAVQVSSLQSFDFFTRRSRASLFPYVQLYREYYPGHPERGSRLWRMFLHHKGDFLKEHTARFSLISLWMRIECPQPQASPQAAASAGVGGELQLQQSAAWHSTIPHTAWWDLALNPSAGCDALSVAGWRPQPNGRLILDANEMTGIGGESLQQPPVSPCIPLLVVQVN
jgi:hypothetical protein